MRTLYRPLHDGLRSALHDIFSEGFPADKVIQRHLKVNRKWGSADRKLFAEALYDMVRWWRKLQFALGHNWPTSDHWEWNPQWVEPAILAWCQLNEVQLDKTLAAQNPTLPADFQRRWQDASVRATAQSVPDWMDQWGDKELGARWSEALLALNTQAPVYLRANRLRGEVQQLANQLHIEQIEAEKVEGDCFRLKKRSNVFLSKAFAAGLFEVQDRHSQHVALALDVQPGMRVVDACAGAGGKSLHLASLMKNQGKIIALDIKEKKLEQLRERSTRAGASCIELRPITSTKVIKRLKDSADRLLLDVPCTGLGVLRRNPDAKWKLRPDEIQTLCETQQSILQNYSSMCKPGGIMVYATCSIMPSENLQQVERFVSQNQTQWRLERQETLWPVVDGGDGFFIAVLQRVLN
jgi:16S rRNA (cytosine967-C5)-methyltransferase